ncbi:MAG: UDP-4-amino-4,6-dideoxy-N-acetyl-beta-L-altrosamine transaminase [Nitrospira sp.]|nr:UDP-4-amino-4,6-dideoxy-N-acetyl-beta-L-altrosamine transaminase [Nitrospira sp.]
MQPDTANIDPQAVEAAITSRTKAIVAVDYAGHPADMDELRVIADKHGLLLIEDAAHSLGSTYRSRPVGSLADITAFSFFPTKNITTAEGGAVAVKDPQLLRKAREFARQGLVRDPARQLIQNQGPWHQEVQQFGLNYRLPDVLAALGSQQLKRLPGFKKRRAEIKAAYDEMLGSVDGIETPAQRDYVDPIWHLYPIRVPPERRRVIFEQLRAGGVGVQVNYLPAYWHPVFADMGTRRGLCPIAEGYYGQEVSLPIYSSLDDGSVEQIGNELVAALTAL